jgi:hypothetical protein
VSTTLTATPNPATLDFGPGTDINLSSLTLASPDCDSTIVDGGKVKFDLLIDSVLLTPVPAGTPTGVWTDVSGFQTPSGGAVSLDLDLDSLGFTPGTVGAFRAHYVTPEGSPPKPGTHFSPAIDVVAEGELCEGFNIAADLAAGNGSPAPGSTGPWTFRITLHNCTGVDLAGIKAQGGSNGWAPLTGVVQSTGAVAIRNNAKNQVLTWNLDLANGASATLLATVDGKIPNSTPCDQVRFLSGPWSAVYDAGSGSQKSDYTGRVSVTVTCPAP